MSVLKDILDSGDLILCFVEKSILFSELTMENKLLVKNSRPMPQLNLKQVQKNKSVRHFQMRWYSAHPWLTGSLQLNKMFCFPCILFYPNMENKWVQGGLGVEHLQNFTLQIQRHTSLFEHIAAVISLKELGKTKVDHVRLKQTREDALKHNEEVKKNRAIVERLIQTICFLAKQELTFWGYNGKKDSDNKGNYLELLDLLSINECIMKEHLVSDTVFKGTSFIIQNELIESINEVITGYIMDEIKKCRFLSIQADETTDVSTKSQLSVILRYVNIGTCNIEERFMGFYDTSTDKTAARVSSVLLNLLNKWQIPTNKLICQTYDGPSVVAGQHGGVHTLVRQDYPWANFIHCYVHQLNLVLLHGSKTIKDVKLFIANITLFHTFFGQSGRRSHLLRERGFKLPHPSETGWNYNSKGVTTIKQHYFELHAALQHVVMDENGDWDSNSIALANSILRVLTDPKFVYFIHFYEQIFFYTDMLYDILQKISTNVTLSITEICNCNIHVSNLRNENSVTTCIQSATEFLNCVNTMEENEDILMEDDDTAIYTPAMIANLRTVSFEILDSVITQMNVRFQDFGQLRFFSLLDVTKFQNYSTTFPAEAMELLISNYPFFNSERLKTELRYIYANPDKHLDPQNLLRFIIDNELTMCVPELTKLIDLLLTIPVTAASLERGMGTFKQIKMHLRSTMTDFRPSNLSMIAIEKRLIKENINNQRFLDQVVEVFANMKERKISLLYMDV